jgi:hypothetical protein
MVFLFNPIRERAVFVLFSMELSQDGFVRTIQSIKTPRLRFGLTGQDGEKRKTISSPITIVQGGSIICHYFGNRRKK